MLADGEYGEFFPLSILLFGYNDTVSFYDYPMTKEEVVKNGWKWQSPPATSQHQDFPETVFLPDDIHDTDRSILDQILTCSDCSKNYRIIAQEFKFYQEAPIPLPRLCPFCRYRDRLALHNQKTMRLILCAHCKKEIATPLDPTEFRQILCEECYLKEVY